MTRSIFTDEVAKSERSYLAQSWVPTLQAVELELRRIRLLGTAGTRVSQSNRYSGLTSCWIDWFDLAVQGTLKSSFQYYSVKNQPICLQCRKIFVLFCNFPTDYDETMWILVKQI